MNPDYARKLGLKILRTNIGAQKIDGSALETFEMVITDFQVEDKASRLRFFEKTFWVANTKFEVILEMLFLKISLANMLFSEETLTLKTYTTNNTLFTTKWVQIIYPKQFVIPALDVDSETFVMPVGIQEREKMPVHSKKQAQVGALLFNKASTEVPAEYSYYSNVFSAENAAKLLENTGINEYAIKLKKGKQPPFGPIYSLKTIELEIFKIYIKINLANNFIRFFKSPARAPTFFDKKPDKNLRFCVNYWGLNNLTIKNQYLLPLIRIFAGLAWPGKEIHLVGSHKCLLLDEDLWMWWIKNSFSDPIRILQIQSDVFWPF